MIFDVHLTYIFTGRAVPFFSSLHAHFGTFLHTPFQARSWEISVHGDIRRTGRALYIFPYQGNSLMYIDAVHIGTYVRGMQ